MPQVKQARVLRNLIGFGLICVGLVWWLGDRARQAPDALALGTLLALPGALLHWRYLARRITRRDRRYERNKIPVRYLSVVEALAAAFVESYYLAIPVVLGVVVVMVTVSLSGHWWTALGASCGLAWAVLLTGRLLAYEWRHGAVYYQYDTSEWSGAEGMLYQCGTVVQPLTPAGKVNMPGGVLWNAVSQSGDTIATGESVEVIAVRRLTLYVDRLPDSTGTEG
jgi:membrane protein implicated in regulation of membrane protease activity